MNENQNTLLRFFEISKDHSQTFEAGEVVWRINKSGKIEFCKAKQLPSPEYPINAFDNTYKVNGLYDFGYSLRQLFKLSEAVELQIPIPDEFLQPDENGYLPDGSIKKYWPCWVTNTPNIYVNVSLFKIGNEVFSFNGEENYWEQIKPLSPAAIADLDAKGFGITDKMNKLKAEKEFRK